MFLAKIVPIKLFFKFFLGALCALAKIVPDKIIFQTFPGMFGAFANSMPDKIIFQIFPWHVDCFSKNHAKNYGTKNAFAKLRPLATAQKMPLQISCQIKIFVKTLHPWTTAALDKENYLEPRLWPLSSFAKKFIRVLAMILYKVVLLGAKPGAPGSVSKAGEPVPGPLVAFRKR